MFEIRTIARGDSRYPGLALKLHDAPKALYVRGNTELLDLPAVAIVGTRFASAHGLMVARSYGRAFAEHGIAVISGLAFGIDAAAHGGALDAHGPTIAVIGSGVDDDSLYPRSNFDIAQAILKEGGLIISENPPGTKPQNWDFPKRNRIIAALARATVVVEAPEKSGALITAKFALELGHDLYAVPADVTRESARGSNKLISFGAPPLLDPRELIELISASQKEMKFDAAPIRPHNQYESPLLEALKLGPAHVDDLIAKTGLPAPAVHAALSSLTLKGAVTELGSMQYSLNAARGPKSE